MAVRQIPRTAPRRAAQQTVSKSISLPAAVGGWNARDSLATMKPDDAVELTNYFPDATKVSLRLGHTPYSVNLAGQVETLMDYAGGGVHKLFAATNQGYIYDLTTGDTFLTTESGNYLTTEDGRVIVLESSHVPDVTGLQLNGRWQWVNFTTTADSYLCAVNGAEDYRVFDGTAWHVDGDGPPYDITGVNSATLIGIHNFKHRLWFVQLNTLKAWYLPVSAIGGAAASLDMSSLCSRGGYLMAMATWTIDAGYGVDDYAVWVTSEGQVLVWRMTDPTDANAIFLVGIWDIGRPVGRRCFTKWYGDLLVITQDGLFPLSAALQSTRLNQRVALSDKIETALELAITSSSGNFGWQVIAYPTQGMLLLNVPIEEGQDQEQYVMNTVSKAWCRFTGWEANCWILYEDRLYFGTNNAVNLAWDTYADIATAISGTILQAFNDFGQQGKSKRFTRMRPTFYSNGSPSIQGDIKVDFDQSAPVSNLNTAPVEGALWDSGVWDIAQWGSDRALINNWQGAAAIGYWGAVRLASSTNGFFLEHVATELVLEGGAT